MKVTSKNFRNLPKGTHRLDRGIYLRVRDNHSGWIFRIQKAGRRFDFSLGGIEQPFDAVRRKALLIQTQIAEGADPTLIMRDRADRRQALPEPPADEPSAPTFGEIYADALEHLEFLRRWKSKGTRDGYWRICEKRLLPILRDVPVSKITPIVAADALKPFWTSTSKAVRTQAALRAVMNYAKLQGLIKDNPAEWVGCLESFLPTPSALEKGVEARHHSAVSPEELQTIARKLARRKKSVSARCSDDERERGEAAPCLLVREDSDAAENRDQCRVLNTAVPDATDHLSSHRTLTRRTQGQEAFSECRSLSIQRPRDRAEFAQHAPTCLRPVGIRADLGFAPVLLAIPPLLRQGAPD